MKKSAKEQYISAKIKKIKAEGAPQKQAVAVAHNYAKRKGY